MDNRPALPTMKYVSGVRIRRHYLNYRWKESPRRLMCCSTWLAGCARAPTEMPTQSMSACAHVSEFDITHYRLQGMRVPLLRWAADEEQVPSVPDWARWQALGDSSQRHHPLEHRGLADSWLQGARWQAESSTSQADQWEADAEGDAEARCKLEEEEHDDGPRQEWYCWQSAELGLWHQLRVQATTLPWRWSVPQDGWAAEEAQVCQQDENYPHREEAHPQLPKRADR